MSYRKQFTKSFDRASRANYRAQSDRIRRLPTSEVVADSDYVEELIGHISDVETRKTRSERGTLPGELGEDTEFPKRRFQRLRRRVDTGDDGLL